MIQTLFAYVFALYAALIASILIESHADELYGFNIPIKYQENQNE